MDAQEFINLQEALIWLLDPLIRVSLGVFVGMSFVTAIYLFFARAAKYMTAVRRRR